MTESSIDYRGFMEAAMQNAARQAIARVLRLIEAEGLPHGHALYLKFRTRCPGVRLPDWLLAEHPEELSIVLEHQFRQLGVSDDAFAVTLYFGGREARVEVPFTALLSFADPPAEFGIVLHPSAAEAPSADNAANPSAGSKAPSRQEGGKAPNGQEGGGKVVSLEEFRRRVQGNN